MLRADKFVEHVIGDGLEVCHRVPGREQANRVHVQTVNEPALKRREHVEFLGFREKLTKGVCLVPADLAVIHGRHELFADRSIEGSALPSWNGVVAVPEVRDGRPLRNCLLSLEG